jgi:SAM-dependent methyltransferase
MPEGWQWDETLYLGSAAYYMRGRLPYAPGLADRLAGALSLDGHGRLVDVGCGPGVLALRLAHLFEEVVGVDPDGGMLAEAERRAAAAGIGHARWVRARAEELPAGLGSFRVATFGQSFHWMDRDRVAATVLDMLEPGGAFVHVSDVKEPPAAPGDGLPYPSPPYEAIGELVRRYLGSVPRAGQGLLRYGTPDGEAVVLRGAGFIDFERLRVPAGDPLVRTTDDLVAWAYSRSGSAPHLFGDRGEAFEGDLRRLLHDASPADRFAEQPPETEVFVWRKPRR